MRIWILSSETPTLGAGGIARYVDNFSRLASRAGHALTVFSIGDADDELEVADGYRLIKLMDRQNLLAKPVQVEAPDQHPAWPYNNMTLHAARSYLMAEAVLARISAEGAPDVIECQDYAALGYFLMLRKLCGEQRLASVPVVVHLHTPDFIVQQLNQYPRFKLPDYWIGRMERACVWMADAVLSPSRSLAEKIQSYLEGARDDIAVIPYPHAGTPAPAAPEQVDRRRLLFAGRTELRKGIEELLQAADRLWGRGVDFTLDIAGGDVPTPVRGGSLARYLSDRYKGYVEAGRLRLLGSVAHEECLRLMRESQAVIAPSLWENFPNVCIEAMRLGRPLVTSDSGGQVEMTGTDGAAAILFSHTRRGDLEAALERALALDEEESARMGAAAAERIGILCDPQDVLRKRIDHFSSVIAAHKPRERFPFTNHCLREGKIADPLPADPLVTVVIPFYNLGPYLAECVDSILASRGVNLEVLVVNDGSTDARSIEALDTLRGRQLPGVRILDIPNGGLARARNTGAREARGELVAFVDADDKVGPDFLSRATALLKQYPNVHLAYSWVRYFDGNRGMWHSWTFDLPYLLCHNMLIPIVMVRRKSFLEHGQNKPHIVYGLEDYEGWWSMAEAGCGGVAIPEPLVMYRIRGASMFREIGIEKKLFLYDLITAEHPDLLARYGSELHNLQNANGPAYGWDQPTMFRAPQDRLLFFVEQGTELWNKLKEENKRLQEAERWHQKELARLLKESE